MTRTLFLLASFLLASCGSEATTELPSSDTNLPDTGVDSDTEDQGSLADMSEDVTQDSDLHSGDMQPDQVEEPEPDAFMAIPICSISLIDAFTIARLAPPAAESNGYTIPSATNVNTLGTAIRQAISAQYPEALATAQSVNYTLCRGAEDYEDTVLFEPSERGTGHAVLAIRLKKVDVSRLMFQAPHILQDRNTLAQSVRFFEELNARVLLASGTHRCASPERGCSGTSMVCNRADNGYAESDMAHSVVSYFQAAHEAVAESYTTDLVVSVHGMARAGVSISNGTRRPVTASSPVARVAKALDDEGIANVTSCNPGTQVPEENFLCGGTNTQGRHLNGSPDACFQNAPTASERFLHLEQERPLRDDPTRMVNVLKMALVSEMGL